MTTLDVTNAKVSKFAALSAGQLFFHRKSGQYELAVALQHDTKYQYWLNLSGSDAFHLEFMEAHGKLTAIVLDEHAPELRVRVCDGAKPNFYDGEHHLGRLLIDKEHGTCIAVKRHNETPTHHKRVTSIRAWKMDRMDSDPIAEYARWSLGYIDASGHWVEVHRVSGTDDKE